MRIYIQYIKNFQSFIKYLEVNENTKLPKNPPFPLEGWLGWVPLPCRADVHRESVSFAVSPATVAVGSPVVKNSVLLTLWPLY